MSRLIALFIISFCLSLLSNAQDKILMLNGHEFNCKLVSDSTSELVYNITKKSGKIKRFDVAKEDVFSYTPEGKTEIILYAQDSIFGNLYSPEGMRVYMMGANDARNNFKAHHITIMGYLICGSIAYYGGDGYLTTLAPPLVFTVGQLIGKIKIREKYMSDKRVKYNDFYADGFEPGARSTRIKKAMIGGFSGSVSGVLLYLLVH